MAIVTRIQPQGAARVNPGNPYARLLKAVECGGVLVPVAATISAPLANPSVKKTSTVGVGIDCAGTNRARVLASTQSPAPLTIFALVDGGTATESIIAEVGVSFSNNFGVGNRGLRVNSGVVSAYSRNFDTATGTTSVPTTAPYTIAATFTASQNKAYLNGKLEATVSTGIGVGASQYIAIGSNPDSTGAANAGTFYWNGTRYLVAVFAGTLSDTDIASLHANPWQLFQAPQRPTLVAATGGTNTQITPAVGALALTGYAPAIAQSANQALTPNAGTLSIAGYAPSIAQPQAVAPGVGSLALTGFAPTIAQSSTTGINPGAGSLALLGYAPTVAQSANVAINPATGTMAFAGYAPTISQPQAVTASAGTLAITGYAPTVTQAITTNVAPDVGLLALTGYAPSVAQSANQQVALQVGSVTFTGFAPSVAQSANQVILPAVGALAITGYAPNVQQQPASPSLVPGVGSLTITGYAPEVRQSGGAGGYDDKKKKRKRVIVDGKPYNVTPLELDHLLDVQRLADEAKEVEKAAKAVAKVTKPATAVIAEDAPEAVLMRRIADELADEDEMEDLLMMLL